MEDSEDLTPSASPQRRNFYRAEVRIPVVIEVLDADQQVTRNLHLRCADLSAGGLLVSSTTALAEKQKLHVSFEVFGEAFAIFSEVTWIRAIEHRKRRLYHCGIRFLELTDQQRSKLLAIVFRWQRETLLR